MKKVKVVSIVLAALLVGSLIVLYLLAQFIYDKQFNYRCTTSAKNAFQLSQFETLKSTRHTFRSNKGQQLVGYLYEQNDPNLRKKGVIIFAHGLGNGGQNGYMDIFHHLSMQGYYVFAYDATGNDESEGDVIGGLPQGWIDLDYAIDHVYTIEETRNLPLMLMGYSWGALSVTNVLNNHPEVKAVVSIAGCNRSMDLIEYQGIRRAGKMAKWLLPFAVLHEYRMYGDYAFSTALKGFEKSDCKVMIVHGARDHTVPIEYGYETYYEKYGTDDRFVFKKYEDRDHDVLELPGGVCDLELISEMAAFFDQSLL